MKKPGALAGLVVLSLVAIVVCVGVFLVKHTPWGDPVYRVYPPGVECDSVQTTPGGCVLAYKDGMRVALVCGSYAVVTED